MTTATKNSKLEQRDLLKKVKKHIGVTNLDLAAQAGVSYGLVTFVFSGLNSNKEVLRAIYKNLLPGWDDQLTPAEAAQIMSYGDDII